MSGVPFVQATAPERIFLAISDVESDAELCFPDDHGEVCWSNDEPLAVCVPYVRADLLAASEARVAELKAEIDRLREAATAIELESREAWKQAADWRARCEAAERLLKEVGDHLYQRWQRLPPALTELLQGYTPCSARGRSDGS